MLAITKENIDAPPTIFRSYDSSSAFQTCKIWQVARATSAATTFFKPIKVGRDGVEFIDAGFGYNNPCEVLIQEVRELYPECRQTILSIGTGLRNAVPIKDTRLSIVNALNSMATSSKTVADRLNSKFSDDDHYCRLNVGRGLEDVTLYEWKDNNKISAHTYNYLEQEDTKRALKKFVTALVREGRS